MSKYTTQIRWIVENETQDLKDVSISQRIKSACPKIFNFDFPIYKEDHRLDLEEKILKHYYTREIGFETVGLWKLYLEEKLNLIMPFYNKLYEMVEKDFLYDYDMEEKFTKTTNDDYTQNFEGTGSNTGNASSSSSENLKTVNSDYPQSTINGGDYATTSSVSENLNQTSSNQSQNTSNESTQKNIGEKTEVYENTKHGRTKPLADIISDYKQDLMNIDNRIINDLSDLFMNIY